MCCGRHGRCDRAAAPSGPGPTGSSAIQTLVVLDNIPRWASFRQVPYSPHPFLSNIFLKLKRESAFGSPYLSSYLINISPAAHATCERGWGSA
eukprot:scaffold35853_cov140-Isochrysis_galbana.AAC.4